MDEGLTPEDHAALVAQLERLREEHRDLDAAIEALRHAGQADQLQLQRLKKRKLLLRDKVAALEDPLHPRHYCLTRALVGDFLRVGAHARARMRRSARVAILSTEKAARRRPFR